MVIIDKLPIMKRKPDPPHRKEMKKKWRNRVRRTDPSKQANFARIARKSYHKARTEALQAYGGKCKCCGEDHPAFLTIDHIKGGGNRHRKIVRAGFSFYAALRRGGYPKGYQILCWSCNCGRAFNGGICPHEERRHGSN